MTDQRLAARSAARPLPVPALAWLVAQREIITEIRSRAFIISTALFVVIIAAGVLITGWFADDIDGAALPDTPTKVAVGPAVTGVGALQNPQFFNLVDAASDEAAIALVAAGEADAALVAAPANGLPFTVVAESAPPTDLLNALTVSPAVHLLNPEEFGGTAFGYFVSLIFGVVFLWAAMLFGQTIAQNTVIEKQTRIVEILLAAVPARALMAGKIIGHSILALGETAVMAATALVCLNITGAGDILSLLTAPILWYIVFFVIGFVLLASLFAGTAALVSRLEDVSTAIMPLTLLLVVPYVLILTMYGNPDAMRVLSYIPIVSTTAMPVRMVLGETAWWEAVISLVILAATTVGAIGVGARVYSRSLLQTDRKVKFISALRAKD
ncbi:MAG: ABC transporter permease [Propionibacteriaceae bacterium]|jgi:ABC-2 type transport system permease protein|nr:ABC transporter permease [Propionibacteriaceae bacterium]